MLISEGPRTIIYMGGQEVSMYLNMGAQGDLLHALFFEFRRNSYFISIFIIQYFTDIGFHHVANNK